MNTLFMILDVGGKSKSDRKGGRMLMMKNRLVSNQAQHNNNDILRSAQYQSAKHGSVNRETTPIKSTNTSKLH
jgi:hypothetical protein